MQLTTYIVRSAAGTRIAGFVDAAQASRSLLPGEVAAIATPEDLAEHRERIKTLIATAQSQARAAAEPDERDVILEALKATLTPAQLAGARQRLRGAKGQVG